MKTFLFSISDIKFKAIRCLMFSSGLRVGEVRHLKCSDIEHSRKRIHIRASKNRSDRYVPLSDNVWELILRYWYSFPAGSRPKDWLFPQKKNRTDPSITSVSPALSLHTKKNSDGSTVLPVTHSAMLSPPTIMKTEPTCSL